MRAARTTRGSRRERGSGSTVVLLVIAIVGAMLGATLIMASTTAVTTGSMRYGEERARLNATTGLALAAVEVEADVKQAFLRTIHQLNGRKHAVDMNLPQLSNVVFPELEYEYATLPGAGNTSDDRATVRAVVTLAGPPKQVGLNGQLSEGKGTHQDVYTFRVRLTSEGRSVFGSRQVARQEAHVYVGVLVQEGRVTSDEPTIASGAMWPVEKRRPVERDPWQIVPAAFATVPSLTIGTVTEIQIGGGAPPSGAWSGPPEVVSGPTPAGLPNGDTVYYWYLRGVPTGSGVMASGAKLVTVDAWRFDPTWRALDDTIEYRPVGSPPVRVKGTPQYAVVVASAPSAYAQSRQSGGTTWSGVELRLPNGQVVSLPVVDRSWVPNMVDLNSPDSGRYRVVADPGRVGAGEGEASFVVDELVRPASPCSDCWRLDAADVSVVDDRSLQITVPGSHENQGLWGGPLGPPDAITLVDVRAQRKRMRASFVAVPAGVEFSGGYVENSTHRTVEAGGQPETDDGGDPWDPPPPGDEPGAMAVVVMYVPLATYFVPDPVVVEGTER
jgi:hypothetical protein